MRSDDQTLSADDCADFRKAQSPSGRVPTQNNSAASAMAMTDHGKRAAQDRRLTGAPNRSQRRSAADRQRSRI